MATTGLFQALMVKNRLRGSDYDRLLDLLNEKTIRLLGIYNRDQAARILCRIVLTQPRLLTFAGLMPWRHRDKVARGQPFAPPTILKEEGDL